MTKNIKDSLLVDGEVAATTFKGSGSQLTGIPQHATLDGFTAVSGGAIVPTDTILSSIEKLEYKSEHLVIPDMTYTTAAAHEALARIARLEQSLNTRTTVTLTLSAATGTVDLGQTFEVLDESASAPGRFRLYRTTAGRDADLARAVEVQEPNTVGLLLEDVFTASRLSVAEDPAPCSSGSDGLCAWSWSGDLGSTISLDLLVKEA